MKPANRAPLEDQFRLAAFHSGVVLPWLAHNVSYGELTTTELAEHALPPEKVTIAIEGSVRSATVEMAFKNYAEIFPAAVEAIPREPKAETFDPDCDVFVYLRDLDPPSGDRLREAHQHRIPIVYALDDDLLQLYGKKPRNADLIATIKRHLSEADCVIAYSRALVAEVSEYNPRVEALLMNMPARYLDHPPPRGDERPVRYLIIGRLVRARELRILADELREFFAAHPDEAKLTVFADQRLEPDYRALLEGIDFDTTPLLHYREFREFLAGSAFDFVINPLRDSPFNRGKSPVKYLEATIAGAVLITSAMPVYKAVEHDVTGIVVPWKEGAWRAALEGSLAMEAGERRRLHAGAVRHLREALTTEANYLPFRTAIEAARLHAAFGPRSGVGDLPAILVDDPEETGLAERLGRLLAPHHFRIITPADLGNPTADADRLTRERVALLHAASPKAGWIAAAVAARLPVVAGWTDSGPAPTEAPAADIVLASTTAATLAARAGGHPHVLRWTPPPPARWNGFVDKPLKANKDGVRIVCSGPPPQWLPAMLESLSEHDRTVRFELAGNRGETAAWEQLFAPFAATFPFRTDVSGPPERRGVVLTVGGDDLAQRSALEAMGYGIPVIAVAAEGMEDLIADGENGCVVEPDAAAIAAAITDTFALPPEQLAERRAAAASTAAILAGPAIASANLLRFYRIATEIARMRSP